MSAYNGSLVLLKILIDNSFITIGGMRATKFSLNNQLIDSSNKDSGSWRQIMTGGGISTMSIAGNGIFTDSQAEQYLRVYAFAKQVANYQLCFGNGDVLVGDFFITNYERSGNYGEEEVYQLSLENAGEVKYILK